MATLGVSDKGRGYQVKRLVHDASMFCSLAKSVVVPFEKQWDKSKSFFPSFFYRKDHMDVRAKILVCR